MGICSSNKKDQGQAISEPRKVEANMEKRIEKHHLQLPSLLEYFGDSPIIEVSDSMAYNFMVKIGVQKQKNVQQSDIIYLYLYQEKCVNAAQYLEYGFNIIDLTRLDKLIEQQKTYKHLLDFKNIWIFQNHKERVSGLFNAFREMNIKIKQLYYYRPPLEKIITEFKMNSEINILNSFFPVLYFDNLDIIDQTKRKDDHFRIYIHNSDTLDQLLIDKQQSLYSNNLQVRNIIFLYADVKFEKQKHLEAQLYKIQTINIAPLGQYSNQIVNKELVPYLKQLQETNSHVVLIYSSQETNSIKYTRDAIQEYLSRGLLIFVDEIKKYIDCLKSLNVPPPSQTQKQVMAAEPMQNVKEPLIISRCEEIKLIYDKFKKNVKSTMPIQSCHQTLLKLLNNIIENPNDDKFRRIKLTNKVINLNILQYKEGHEVLQQAGFVQKDDEFINNFDVGMLRLVRGDLELAMKQFISQ